MKDMLIKQLKNINKALEADRDKYKALAEIKHDKRAEALLGMNKRLSKIAVHIRINKNNSFI